MEVITMESKAYQELIGLVQKVARYVLKQEQNQSQYEDIWLNDADMIRLLGVSKRTLQRMRSNNDITFSKIRKVCRYHYYDVLRAIRDKRIFCDQETLDNIAMEYKLRLNK